MADQRDYLLDSRDSVSTPADVTDVRETDHDTSNAQREADHFFNEKFTDDSEQYDQTLHIETQNAPRELSDNASQPRSAFSPDSSDEDADADDEGEERDDDAEDYQANEWENFSSPEPPENKQPTNQFGVLPELSPQAGDQCPVSSLSDCERDSKPRPGLGHRRTYKSSWDWSSEEEDDVDLEWYQKAIEDLKNARRTPEGSLSEDLAPLSTIEEEPTGSHDSPVSPNDEALLEDDHEALPGSPVSPLDPVDFFEGPNAVNETSEQPSRVSDLPLSMRVGNIDSDVEDGAVVLSRAHQEHSEDYNSIATAPEGFKPVFDNARLRSPLPMSPDRNKPELLTGLTPQEGADSWREWHDRAKPQWFRTNRNPDMGDRTGDLNPIDDSRYRDSAADFLKKNRFILKKETCRESIQTHSDAKSDQEETQEYMQLQMHRYRYQRNEILSQRNELISQHKKLLSQRNILSRDLKDSEERVSRRDQIIKDLDREIAETQDQFCTVSMQLDKLADENKAIGSQLNHCHQHGKKIQSRVEDLSKQLDESQQALEMTRQRNDCSLSDLSERLQTAEDLARDRQAIIEYLEAQLSARSNELSDAQVLSSQAGESYRGLEANKDELQKELDQSTAVNTTLQNDLDAARREVQALQREARLQRKAWLERNQYPSYPSGPCGSTRPPRDNGTQVDNVVLPLARVSPVEAISSPVRPTQQQEPPADTTTEPPRWAARRRAIMQQPSAIKELESYRAAREQRRRRELERLDQIQQHISACIWVNDMP